MSDWGLDTGCGDVAGEVQVTGAESQPLIKVIGVGGGGSNAIDRMIHVGISGVQFIAANTDAQALTLSEARHKVQLGPEITSGLGAGGDPTVGARAAQESSEQIRSVVRGAEVLFVALGLGGGTGTGAAPVIADLARQEGALTVAVATLPFSFEGYRRGETARQGLETLAAKSDTVVAISNDRLLEFIDDQTSMDIAFRIADDVLRQGIQGVAELITNTGLINLNLMHVRKTLRGAGPALMSIGQARGEERAIEAAELAIASPLTQLSSIAGASAILVNVTGGDDLSLNEVQEAVSTVSSVASPEADILFGATLDPNMAGLLQVMLIAVGMNGRTAIPFYEPSHQETSRHTGVSAVSKAGRAAILDAYQERTFDVHDLDVPTFLRRRRLARIGEERA
ncbi:MAG: cell division protein FtsZ [Anaerolineae bacterium]|nr:cell division protein FtsZ [Anaerolineae bacterium]